ncbi:MAG: ATP-binding protein [bacterium]
MKYFQPATTMIANNLKEYCLNLLDNSRDKEYFLIMTDVLQTLGFEVNNGFKDISSGKVISNNDINNLEKQFLKEVFNSLMNEDIAKKNQLLHNLVSLNYNFNNKKFSLIPYLVDDNSGLNKGNQGYAGKIRDNLNVRKSNTCIIVFDVQPIETLITASDKNILSNVIERDYLKRYFKNDIFSNWYEQLVDYLFDYRIVHSLNVIERINKLYDIKGELLQGNNTDINYYINKYNLPLFYIEEYKNLKNNYELFCEVNNTMLENISGNFRKEVLDKLTYSYLPDTIEENELIEILKKNSLHLSKIYQYSDFTYKVARGVFKEKGLFTLKGVDVNPNNGQYGVIKSTKKVEEGVISKGNLDSIEFTLKGDLGIEDIFYLHYYYNNYTKESKIVKFVDTNCTLNIDKEDINKNQTLNIVINQRKNDTRKPLLKGKFVLEKKASSIIIPNAENMTWEKGDLYPTITIDEAENQSGISCTVITERGEKEKKHLPIEVDMNNKNEGGALYNIYYNGKAITKVILKNNQDEAPEVDHLVHFIAEKGLESIDEIQFKKDCFSSFIYRNTVYKYKVNNDFSRLLKNYDYDDINDLYRLVLDNPEKYYYIYDEGFKDVISNEAEDVLLKRTELLSAFRNLYNKKNNDLQSEIEQLHTIMEEYIKMFIDTIDKVPSLIKIDTLVFDNYRILSPFSPINISFYLKCWNELIDNDKNTELLKAADNSEAFKFISGDRGWFICQSPPAFSWLYYVSDQKDNYKFGSEKFLKSIIKNKLKHLDYVYPQLFSMINQTIHIGLLNPDNAQYFVEGLKAFLKEFNEDDNIPNFHLSLIYNELTGNEYSEIDRIYEKDDKNDLEEKFIKNISYSKITLDNVIGGNYNFFHILFVKDLFEIAHKPSSMVGIENKFNNTYYGFGYTIHPSTKAAYNPNYVKYENYTNYRTDYLGDSLYEKVLSATNLYYTQAFETDIKSNVHHLRTVNVSTENIPYQLFESAFLVTFLDREIDIDIFNSEHFSDAKKPFLVDYSNYTSFVNGGSDDVKFLTITNQKQPFLELFKNTLDLYPDINHDNNILISLFNDLNLLNGFWVLDLLKNAANNENQIKGILGTLGAFRTLMNHLKEDKNYWHIVIGIEEFIGVVPGYRGKVKMRFDDTAEGNKYCDDLAIITFPRNINKKENFDISIRLVEVKNSKIYKYISKGIIQLEETTKKLKSYFDTGNNILDIYKKKDIVNWLIYTKNKYQIFNKEFLGLQNNGDDLFSKDLRKIIDRLNHGESNVKIEDGVLFVTNTTPEINDKLDLQPVKYISLTNEQFCKVINNNFSVDIDEKINDIFDYEREDISAKRKSLKENELYVNESEENIHENKNFESQKEEAAVTLVAEDSNSSVFENATKPKENKYRLLLGKKQTFSSDLVYYDPKRKGENLSNPNVMITGSSGRGKTQLLKSMLLQEINQGVNFLIFDFKNDFSEPDFLNISGVEYVNLEVQGLPYNPLIPAKKVDRALDQEFANVNEHIFAIAGVLKTVYGLGVQQEAALKKALREVYEENGINTNKNIELKDGQIFPVLDDIGGILEEESPSAYARMDPIFNYGLFGRSSSKVSLTNILNKSYIFNLSSIANDHIKNAISKLVVVSVHQYLNSLKHSSKIKNIFVFDEAHRFLGEPRLTALVRECRAYGLAVWLSSQYPTDFPNDIAGSLETKIIHGNGEDDKQVKNIINLTGFTGDIDIIKEMGLFEALVINGHYKQALINTIGYPHLLVLREAYSNGIVTNEKNIKGVEESLQYEVINHLVNMKLLIFNEAGYIISDSIKDDLGYMLG